LTNERYLAKVSAALATLQEATCDMRRQRRDGSGELWISSLPFFTSAVLLPALPDFKRRHLDLTLRIEATHQYADFNASRVDVAIRYGREHSAGLKFEPLVEVKGLPVCALGLAKAELRKLEDLARRVLIHLTTQPRAWPAWLKEAGLPHLQPRGHLWLDSVPAMLDAAEQGLGVTLAMAPLIRSRSGFGKKLVAPLTFMPARGETIYLVSRTEQGRDRRIAAPALDCRGGRTRERVRLQPSVGSHQPRHQPRTMVRDRGIDDSDHGAGAYCDERPPPLRPR
jgi:LysR family glycine cleavage system transcriptional activator